MGTKKWIIIGISATILGVGGFVISSHISNSTQKEKNASATSPEHTAFLPKGRSIEDLGGWRRVSPPHKEPVFAFTDTVDGVAISVSQQAIPQEFVDSPEKSVEKLAKAENATNIFKIDRLTVYMGESVRGPQTLVFTKDNTLIFIKSQSKIAEDHWVNYIKNLK